MGRIFENPLGLLVVLLIIVLIFGANKLPDAARSLGRSARIFRSEVDQMNDDHKEREGQRELGSTAADTVRREEKATDEVHDAEVRDSRDTLR